MEKEIREAIERVFKRSSFILGEEAAEFEKEFAAYTGAKHAVAVGNGTDAIRLVLMALGIGEGDEVITTSLSAFPTAEAIFLAGATPVFVDIDENTANLDPANVEKALTARTKAVLAVHLYGLPANIFRLKSMCRAKDIHFIEDCAQAHGSRVMGVHVGTIGVAGCFSFYPSKNLGGISDGGMVITGNDDVAETIRMLRDHGRKGRYEHLRVGVNSRMSGIAAAVLRVKLRRLDRDNDERREIAFRYKEALDGSVRVFAPNELLDETELASHVFHQFVIRVKAEYRTSLRETLKEAGVGTEVHYPIPLHLHAASARAFPDRTPPTLVRVERVVKQIVSLPIYPTLTKREISHVLAQIERWEGSISRNRR